MPPARTGVADYSAALVAALRKIGDVSINDPDADISLYHLGNNQLHRPIYERALAHPGVVVLHDAVLHHFFWGPSASASMSRSSSTTTVDGTPGWRNVCGGIAAGPASIRCTSSTR
jgi:hypothetical protein